MYFMQLDIFQLFDISYLSHLKYHFVETFFVFIITPEKRIY